MTTPSSRVPFYEKLGFGLGELGNNLFWQFFMYFQLFFYTDIFKIAPGERAALVAGQMFVFIKFADALFDVLVGIVADRTKTRWGKYRPYLLWGAFPFGLAGLLAFTTPDLADGPKLIYAYITYTFLMMMYSLVAIPQNSLLGVMTSDIQERTVLSKYKFVCAFAAGFIVSAATGPLITFFGRGNAQRGYQLAVVCYAVIAIAFFIVAFVTIRERVQPPQEKTNLRADLKDLLAGNLPWLILSAATLVSILHIALRTGTFAYYFKYYVKGQEVDTLLWGVRHFSQEELLAGFLTFGTVVNIVGVMLVPTFTRLLGKRLLYCILIVGAGLVSAAFYYVPPTNVPLIFALHALGSITLGPTSAVLWPMYADCADYSEWKHGRRATALVFSAAIMAQKLGWAFAGYVTGALLTRYGYIADTLMSENTLHGILLVNTLYPAVFAFAAGVLIMIYGLSDKRMKQIQVELEQRRQGAPAQSAVS